MKRIVMNVGGKEWPCRLTMGAMLQFKRHTGRDVSQIDLSDPEDMLMLVWCCIGSESRAEGLEFDVDFELFCDLLGPEDMQVWNEMMAEANAEQEKKSE